MKREFLQGLKVGEQALHKEIIDAIMAENGKDIQQARGAAQEWEDKYNRAAEEHAAALAKIRLDSALQGAVQAAGGRNLAAISALLDMEAISKSEDIPGALESSLEQLKQEHDYLFQIPGMPVYSALTGTGNTTPHAPATLAGALREKYAKE